MAMEVRDVGYLTELAVLSLLLWFHFFAVRAQVDLPSASTQVLPEASELCDAVQNILPGFLVSVQAEPTPLELPVFSARFFVTLADDVGVLSDVSSVFANHGLNIVSLSSAQELAPFCGTTLFSMRGHVSSMTPVNTESILEDLNRLSTSSGIQVEFEPDKTEREEALPQEAEQAM